MVGGYTTVEIAKKYNIPAVMIESGRESVNTAIADAKAAAEIALREKEKSNEIANIMNYSFQGIIFHQQSRHYYIRKLLLSHHYAGY